MARDITRVTVNLNSELVEQVDKYAEEMNINRTAAVAVLLSQAVNSQKAVNELGELLTLVKAEQLKQGKED
jgi:metal-responsive CopG/Arc/MetJ family transcriptional regulator